VHIFALPTTRYSDWTGPNMLTAEREYTNVDAGPVGPG
jgi:hypothetical protein